MIEGPPQESIQTPPEPVRIFSGARLKPDGTFVSPAHQKISDLWRDEMERRNLPGTLRRIPTTVDKQTRISLRITPQTQDAKILLEKIRSRLEEAVSKWIRDGEPNVSSIADFRNQYIPNEETKSEE